MRRSLAVVIILLSLSPSAWAGDARRAGEIQRQAEDALSHGDAEEALRLARRAISLEDGPSTWLAQQIRIEILEKRGQLDEAMAHLKRYLSLDGLFPEHVAWGEEARQRLGAELARVEQQRGIRRGLGAALVGVGAVPIVLGVASLANYGDKIGSGADPLAYQGYTDAGAVGLIVGGVMEGVGIALLVSSSPRRGLAMAPVPWFVADGRVALAGLSGRF